MKNLVKRMSMLMLCTFMVLSSCLNIAAKEKRIQIDTQVNRLNPNDYVTANAMLVQKGRIAKTQRSSVTLAVPHYYQDGGRVWSNDIMQTAGESIASSGCCLTSFTMIHKYLGGIWNPRGVNNKMGNAACPFEYTTAANIFKYEISNYHYGVVSDDYAIDFIIGAIDSGLPVLVGMTPDDTTKDTHFVTAYGYNGSTIYIHDPATYKDYTELSQYLANYSVHRLYVYTN